MKSFIRKNGIFIIAAAVVIAIIAVAGIISGADGSDAAGGTVNTVMRPLRGVMSSVVSRLEDIYGYMYEFDTLKSENEELKVRVAELEREYREYEEVAEENERLNRLLGFSREHYDYELTQAAVMAYTSSSWQSAFTIGKGSDAGIKNGSCVITEEGFVVGRVTSVSSSSAVVTTLIDTTSNIGALLWDRGDSCVLCGDFSLMQKGEAKLSYLPDACTAAAGDTVTTSGAGGIFPRGLVLGTVERVSDDESGTGGWAVVRPSAELMSLDYVCVITAFGDGE